MRRVNGVGVIGDDRGVAAFGVGPFLITESDAGQSHFEKGVKLVSWKIAFQSPTLLAIRVEDQNGRCPERVKAAKVLRVLFDVNAEGDKIFVDERRQTGVFVRLLFEPQTGSSIRCRAEIYKQRLALSLCFLQRLVGVFCPVDCHKFSVFVGRHYITKIGMSIPLTQLVYFYRKRRNRAFVGMGSSRLSIVSRPRT